MKLALYGYWRSSSSWRVRIALALKNLEYEHRSVHLAKDGGEQWKPEHLAKNPTGHVPVLEVRFPSGEVKHLGQSLAMLELLEEEFPEPPLLPFEPLLRAHCRQLAETVNSSIQPYQNLITLKAVADIGGDQKAWLARFLGSGLASLETLTARHAGRFSVGNHPTFADCCLVPQMYAARRHGVELSPFPTLLRIEQECASVPAFQAAHADRQPDTPPPENR